MILQNRPAHSRKHICRSAQAYSQTKGLQKSFRRAMAESGTCRLLILSKDYTRGPEGGTIVFYSRFVGGESPDNLSVRNIIVIQ